MSASIEAVRYTSASSGSTLVARAIEPAPEGQVRWVTCWNLAAMFPSRSSTSSTDTMGPRALSWTSSCSSSATESRSVSSSREVCTSLAVFNVPTGRAGFTTTGRQKLVERSSCAGPLNSSFGCVDPGGLGGAHEPGLVAYPVEHPGPRERQDHAVPSGPVCDHRVDRLLAARIDHERPPFGRQLLQPAGVPAGIVDDAGDDCARRRHAWTTARRRSGSGPRPALSIPRRRGP